MLSKKLLSTGYLILADDFWPGQVTGFKIIAWGSGIL
jgi:hypothetical protein